MNKKIWNYFDKFYIITLKDKNVNKIKRNLNKVGIENYEILRYKGAKKRSNVSVNSTLYDLMMHNNYDKTAANIKSNHLKTMKKAYNLGLNNIVILEDDALFDIPFNYDKLKIIIKWLENNSWDIFFFGNCPWPPISIIQNKHIVKPLYPLLAHCYSINRNGIKNILSNDNISKKIHIDKIFAYSKLKLYAVYPSISKQYIAPAIYREIIKKIGINIDFNNIVYIMETLGIIMPLLIFILIIYIIKYIYRIYFNNKYDIYI
jgi:hypothetical protein